MNQGLDILEEALNAYDISFSIQTFEDRKSIQRAVYLMQVLGVNLGYRFGWSGSGPYSTDLAGDYYDLDRMVSVGLIRRDASGGVFEDLANKTRSLLNPPAELEISRQEWLSLLASTHFLLTKVGKDPRGLGLYSRRRSSRAGPPHAPLSR